MRLRLLAVPEEFHGITGLIVCTRCKGELFLGDEPCPRCQVDGVPTGIDPEARCGCTEEYEETREQWHEHWRDG